MRRLWCAVTACLLMIGCAGPHSNGGLWSLQNLEREAARSRVGEAEQLQSTRWFEASLGDEALAAERTRVTAELDSCPGPRQPLGVSPGDTVRDIIRLRAHGEPGLLAQTARVALADWRIRRARATGNQQFCQDARAALDAGSTTTETARGADDLLSSMPDSTVSRDPRYTTAPTDSQPPIVALSNYALGYVDAVHAAAPLPQYLELVYGGYLYISGGGRPASDDETAARLVDRDAAAYPEWEPDALYAGLRGGSTPGGA
jgi:hypothetical protein